MLHMAWQAFGEEVLANVAAALIVLTLGTSLRWFQQWWHRRKARNGKLRESAGTQGERRIDGEWNGWRRRRQREE